MKKILSLLVLLAAFCVASFAQSAPKASSKAMLLPNNTAVKDLKTGKVVRITKGTVPVSKTKKKVKMTMTRNGVVPSNSKQSSGNIPVKKQPANIKKLERQ